MKRSNEYFVNLGDRVRDTVSGFEGIAVSATEFLNGCRRIRIVAPVKEDGSYSDERWFDEPQMIVLARNVWQPPFAVTEQKTGGDRPDCPSR